MVNQEALHVKTVPAINQPSSHHCLKKCCQWTAIIGRLATSPVEHQLIAEFDNVRMGEVKRLT